MATFSGIEHIGEKIFNCLQNKDILNCRNVCHSWKQILDNPNLWLKKLNSFGQAQKSYEECSELLAKASEINFPPAKLGNCLMIKYVKVTEAPSQDFHPHRITRAKIEKFVKFITNLPLLYFALVPKEPDLDLIKFLSRETPDVDKPEPLPSFEVECYIRLLHRRVFTPQCGTFMIFPSHVDEIDPISDAILVNKSLEVIKTLLTELKIKDPWYGSPLYLAVENQDLDMCKMIIELLGGDQVQVPCQIYYMIRTPIQRVIELRNVEIFKYFLSKNLVPKSYLDLAKEFKLIDDTKPTKLCLNVQNCSIL